MLCSFKKKKIVKVGITTFFWVVIFFCYWFSGISTSYLPFCQFWNNFSTFHSFLLLACYLPLSAVSQLSLGLDWTSDSFFRPQEREIKLCLKTWPSCGILSDNLDTEQSELTSVSYLLAWWSWSEAVAHVIKCLSGKICSAFPQMCICLQSLQLWC